MIALSQLSRLFSVMWYLQCIALGQWRFRPRWVITWSEQLLIKS